MKELTILRPYDAKDNEINMKMRKIIENYLIKNNEVISHIEIFDCALKVKTQSGRTFNMTMADGCMAKTYEKRNYFYIKEKINNKWVRIKKEEW